VKVKFKSFLILSLSILSLQTYARQAVDSKRYELLSGVRGNSDPKTYWDKKYSNTAYVFGKVPAKFLSTNYNFIPEGGSVLDVGMGEGRNAVFLARKGYRVTGVDISSVAVKKAKLLAQEFGVRINTVVTPMEKYQAPKGGFDAVICFYYVDRKLHDQMLSWLKPGGLLIYESFTDHQLKVPGYEQHDPRYLLRPGELLSMFKGVRVVKYEEPLHNEEFTASIILQKI
jgi:2-polyprenyl-3-methyl-5-hydroxy-6-metoxy-1,4-benzoquinol methylase